MAQDTSLYVEKQRKYFIARVVALFDKAKALIENAEGGKFRIPPAWLNQQVREERGYNDYVALNGNYVLEGILYRLKENDVLTRIGLPYLHPTEAVSAHKRNKEYTLEGCTSEEISRAVADGLEISPNDLNEEGHLPIPCDKFGSNKYGLWFFGGTGTDEERSERAKKSGQWLINSPWSITGIIVYLTDKKDTLAKKDFANQLWLCGLGRDGRSGFFGDGRLLGYGVRALGVSDSAEGVRQKITKLDMSKILEYSAKYVPEARRKEFQTGLIEILNQ